jgi:PAS domain S-box-containing protein
MADGARALRLSKDSVHGFAAYVGRGLSEFLESIPDAMILSDHKGRILYVNTNAERMFGYSRDELLGNEVEILVPERFRGRHRRDREAYYRDPTVRPMGMGEDLYACGKDGAVFLVEISLSPVEIRGKALVWSAIRNINDRDRAFAQLREAIVNKRIDLRGFISTCAWCKRVRGEGGSWQRLEEYIESHSRAKFTHGICDDCLRRFDRANTEREEA